MGNNKMLGNILIIGGIGMVIIGMGILPFAFLPATIPVCNAGFYSTLNSISETEAEQVIACFHKVGVGGYTFNNLGGGVWATNQIPAYSPTGTTSQTEIWTRQGFTEEWYNQKMGTNGAIFMALVDSTKVLGPDSVTYENQDWRIARGVGIGFDKGELIANHSRMEVYDRDIGHDCSYNTQARTTTCGNNVYSADDILYFVTKKIVPLNNGEMTRTTILPTEDAYNLCPVWRTCPGLCPTSCLNEYNTNYLSHWDLLYTFIPTEPPEEPGDGDINIPFVSSLPLMFGGVVISAAGIFLRRKRR